MVGLLEPQRSNMIERTTTATPGMTLTIRALFWEVEVEKALGGERLGRCVSS
jgi:hypothetical protein